MFESGWPREAGEILLDRGEILEVLVDVAREQERGLVELARGVVQRTHDHDCEWYGRSAGYPG